MSEKGKKQAKPRPDFPLTPHSSGQWCKKIKGKIYYFGADATEALRRYLNEREHLEAGRLPPVPRDTAESATIVSICNAFLTYKQFAVEAGELAQRTWNEYQATCARIVDQFGKQRMGGDLRPTDFEAFRAALVKIRHTPASLGPEIQRVRTVFKYAFEAELLEKPVRFGPGFKRPPKKSQRIHEAARGKLMFSASEIQQMLAAASVQLRAMTLLGINCAFGQSDVATLPRSVVDLEKAWIEYPRPKTGIERRCPLWPETVAAIESVLESPRNPASNEHAGLVFLTHRGAPYVRMNGNGVQIDSVSLEAGKLLRRLKIKRHRLNFYSLRRTFRTVADVAGDPPAVDLIMGPDDAGMGARYRQGIANERLQAISEIVRTWLFVSSNAKN